jgi:hypothetical protein
MDVVRRAHLRRIRARQRTSRLALRARVCTAFGPATSLRGSGRKSRVSAPVEVVDEAGGRTCLIPVRAQPGARRTALAGTWNGCLKLAVAAPPEDGRANDELTALLAQLFGLKARAVELVSGATSRQKRFRLGLGAELARTKLAALLAELES